MDCTRLDHPDPPLLASLLPDSKSSLLSQWEGKMASRQLTMNGEIEISPRRDGSRTDEDPALLPLKQEGSNSDLPSLPVSSIPSSSDLENGSSGASPRPENVSSPKTEEEEASEASEASEAPEYGVDAVADIIDYFVRHHAATRSTRTGKKMRSVQDNVNALFQRDYHISTVDNTMGEFCSSYPLDIVVLENEKQPPHPEEIQGNDTASTAERQPVNDVTRLRELFRRSRFSRVHGRFVTPVIMYQGKNICRSATLSIQVEMFLNKTKEFIGSWSWFGGGSSKSRQNQTDFQQPTSTNLEQQREADLALLEALKLQYICDLMVETKKKKFGMLLTSSEKVESQRYGAFSINSIPYPGCEFFKEYKDNSFNANNLRFDWDQDFVNATLMVDAHAASQLKNYHPMSDDEDLGEIDIFSSAASQTDSDAMDIPFQPPRELSVDEIVKKRWEHYRSWDLVEITANYLQFILTQISDPDEDAGVLIHCISGWDRTPLFLSLVRITLWADNVIHQSLTPEEFLYLTVGYDWMLFGHNITDRLEKGEDIFYFCFDFLQYITDQRYSIHRIRRDRSLGANANTAPPPSPPPPVAAAAADHPLPLSFPRDSVRQTIPASSPAAAHHHHHRPAVDEEKSMPSPGTALDEDGIENSSPAAAPSPPLACSPEELSMLEKMNEMNHHNSKAGYWATFDGPPPPSSSPGLPAGRTSLQPQQKEGKKKTEQKSSSSDEASDEASSEESSLSSPIYSLVSRWFGGSPAGKSPRNSNSGGADESVTAEPVSPPSSDRPETNPDGETDNPQQAIVAEEDDAVEAPSSEESQKSIAALSENPATADSDVDDDDDDVDDDAGQDEDGISHHQRSDAIRIPTPSSSSSSSAVPSSAASGRLLHRGTPSSSPGGVTGRSSRRQSGFSNSQSSVGSILIPPGSWQMVEGSRSRAPSHDSSSISSSAASSASAQHPSNPAQQQQRHLLLQKHQPHQIHHHRSPQPKLPITSSSNNSSSSNESRKQGEDKNDGLPTQPSTDSSNSIHGDSDGGKKGMDLLGMTSAQTSYFVPTAAGRSVISVKPYSSNASSSLKNRRSLSMGSGSLPASIPSSSSSVSSSPSAAAAAAPAAAAAAPSLQQMTLDSSSGGSSGMEDSSSSSSEHSSSAASPPFAAPPPPSAGEAREAAASVLRVERLLTLRNLFQEAYLKALPHYLPS